MTVFDFPPAVRGGLSKRLNAFKVDINVDKVARGVWIDQGHVDKCRLDLSDELGFLETLETWIACYDFPG